jgi:hypothetical protein
MLTPEGDVHVGDVPEGVVPLDMGVSHGNTQPNNLTRRTLRCCCVHRYAKHNGFT